MYGHISVMTAQIQGQHSAATVVLSSTMKTNGRVAVKNMKIWKEFVFEYSQLAISACKNTWDLGNSQKIQKNIWTMIEGNSKPHARKQVFMYTNVHIQKMRMCLNVPWL